MNGLQYAVAAWLPIVIFPQTMAPDFRYGFPSTLGFVIAGLIVIVVIQLLHVREQRRRKAYADNVETDSADGEGVAVMASDKLPSRVAEAEDLRHVV